MGSALAVPVPHPASWQFLGFDSSSGLDLRRDAEYDSDALVLSYEANQAGYAYLPSPVQVLRDVAGLCVPLSFASRFSFKISAGSSGGWAAGFTFLLVGGNVVDKSYVRSNDGADLGLDFNLDPLFTPGVLAVEFDTFQDASVKDKEAGHVGINLRFKGFSEASIATRGLGMPLNDSKVKTAWVEYNSPSLTLAVYLSYGTTKPASPILQYKVDTCQLLRTLCHGCWELTSAYVGFSALTAEKFQTVEVLNWDFSTYL